MTHAPTPATTAHHFRLSTETWEEIGAAYRNGATASALARVWKVSPKTIYRQAKRRGWSKRHDADAIVRASMAQVVDGDPPESRFVPDPRFYIERYSAGDLLHPATVSAMAAHASGGALVVGDFAQALVLAQIAAIHARIVKAGARSPREIIVEALENPDAREDLFCATLRDGEDDLKHRYRLWRERETRRWADLEARLAAAEARVQALDGGTRAGP